MADSDEAMAAPRNRLTRNRSTRLVVHANDQQLVNVPLIVDAERRDRPTSYESPGSQSQDGAVKFPGCQALDAMRELGVEVYSGVGITFVKVGDRLDDVS